ncbi:MAG: N,N-dimethylformamidase beta subunit family domain-containing protein [Janthinobacterium lividum]
MIRGYPGQASVRAGEPLVLHVAGDEPRFRIALYRWEDGLAPVWRGPWLHAEDTPEGRADEDWRWPPYRVDTQAGWPAGVYLAHFETPQGGPLRLSAQSAAALFVVRGHPRQRMLYKLPVATWHAYNCSGGACFYTNPPRSDRPPGARVSLRRPGGGIGGQTWGAPNHYDCGSARQTFAHWDARFIRWMARHGYAADFCTDLDLHAEPALLQDYRLLVSVGHDEYCTERTRDAVEGFVSDGGNLAFFGANLCWWRPARPDPSRGRCRGHGLPPGQQARRPGPLVAGQRRRASGRRAQRRQLPSRRRLVGWPARHPRLPGPAAGALGVCRHGPRARRRVRARYLAAAGRVRMRWRTGRPRRAGRRRRAVGLARRSRHARRLPAAGSLSAGPALAGRRRRARGGNGMFRRGGTVFSAGTTDWAQVLGDARDRQVERITRNVLDRLGAG